MEDTHITVPIAADGGLRTSREQEASDAYVNAFERSSCDTKTRLAHMVRYMRRQDMTRLMARYEIFKEVLHVKGSVVECGVYHGSGLMSWALFSDMLEPVNLTRRIYGFDTFSGFHRVSAQDQNTLRTHGQGDLSANVFEELTALIHAYDLNRFLGHVEKVKLVPGDAAVSIPAFIKSHPHLVVSLLFLDFDLYEPTKAALEHFVPRMPKGSIIAFDELDNPLWPGETMALLDSLTLGKLAIRRLPFDPYIGYAVIE